MPVFVAWIGTMLLNIAGSVALQILTSLGIGVVTYTGVNASLDWLKGEISSSAGGLPAEVLGMMATMKVGSALSVVFSAMVARQVINGMTSDAVKRWVTK